MKQLVFLSPHSDDETLYGAYIIQIFHPWVIVVTDGIQHLKKFNISLETRREESKGACDILGTTVEFLGLSDENLDVKILEKEFNKVLWENPDLIVFAPTKQGGNKDHDLISDIATEVFKGKILYYSTYAKDNFEPTGEIPIYLDGKFLTLKNKALKCYNSQLRINKPHFDAVIDKPEYMNLKQ